MEAMRTLALRTLPALILLALLSAGPVLAATDTDVTRATLKNGLRVVIVRDTLAPIVTTMLNYLVGANETPAGFPGTSHAVEHMMFRGSPGLTADQLSTIIAALGGDVNADTQQTVTQYFFTVPAEDLEIVLRIEAIRMQGVLATEALWRQERGAIEQEVAQDLSEPEYLLYSRLLEQVFAGTPYDHDALGTRESFQKTTGRMLRRFQEAWYAPNNAVLVIVGDVDPSPTLATVRRLFDPIPAHPLPPRPEVQVRPLKATTLYLDTDRPVGLAVVAYRLPGYDSPGLAAGQILAGVLDSQRGNLYGLVPEGKALSSGFSVTAFPKSAMGYATAAFPSGADGSTLLATIKDVIAGYARDGIPADLVEAVKRHAVADAQFRKNSIPGLAAEWSQAVAVEGRSSPDDVIQALQKVTVAEVNRVAREYLVSDTAIAAVLTPRPSGGPVASTRLPGQESFAPRHAKPVALPAWARPVLAPPALPASAIRPSVTVLPNGVRLIVQPETVSPTVSVYGQVKSNPELQAPKGQEGVAEILNGLFAWGTTTLDRLAYQEALDGIGANASAGTTFSLEVLAEHFDQGVQLLADNLLHPAIPEEGFNVLRRQTASALTGELQSPGYLSRRALRTALYPTNDPTLRQATPDTMGSLHLEDLKAYYHAVFRPDMTTIVVIGQVTPEQARTVIQKYFGGWKASGPKPVTDLPPVPLNEPAQSIVPDASRVQDKVTLAQTLGLTRSHPDYYALQVGNHVLSGALYATRLTRDLRERAGLVYGVDSFLEVGKTRGIFGVAYACDPSNVSKARTLVERDLDEMRLRAVSAHELQQAKILLLRQIPLSESSRDRIGERLLRLSMEELPLDEPTQAAHRYLEITAAEVQAAFAKWIRPRDFVQVTVGPQPD